ncbi:MAG TPA: hypothetical protein VMU08_09095 [Rhizomicrobium sp.]|nr:hypothetical protein [Rhizomicrobium sp.]
MTSFRVWLVASLALALLAWGVPWLTHFADRGLSLLLLALWLASVVGGLIRFRWRGLWLLLGAPLALFWVVTIALVAGDLRIGF